MQPTERTADDLPLPHRVTAEDIGFAVRAVTVHAAEHWPTGPVCRNDRAPHPCRLHRWGRRVLEASGWSPERIADLATGGDRPTMPPEGER